MKLIRSRTNPFFRELVRLAGSGRERRRLQTTVLDGAHLLQACREAGVMPDTLVVSEGGLQRPEVAELLAAWAPMQPVVLADALFREASPVQTPSGIMALVRWPFAVDGGGREDFAVLLEGVQDPGNVGSILRSAAAAGAGRAWLSPDCADPWSPKVLRAGMGAHFALAVHERADLLEVARRFPGRVVAMVPRGAPSLYATDLAGALAFAIGGEGAGLSPSLLAAAHERVTIPMPGRVESLNAAAAAAICLAEKLRQELDRESD